MFHKIYFGLLSVLGLIFGPVLLVWVFPSLNAEYHYWIIAYDEWFVSGKSLDLWTLIKSGLYLFGLFLSLRSACLFGKDHQRIAALIAFSLGMLLTWWAWGAWLPLVLGIDVGLLMAVGAWHSEVTASVMDKIVEHLPAAKWG